MKNLILTLIITLPITLWGQGWEQNYDYGNNYVEKCYSIIQTSDGGFVFTGDVQESWGEYTQVFVTKIDDNGIIVWTKEIGNEWWDYSYSIQQTTDGGYIITGSTEIDYEEHILIVKIDENGNEQWTKIFEVTPEDDRGNSIQQTSDGGYIISGYENVNSDLDGNLILLKIDELGNEVWVQSFDEFTSRLNGRSVLQTSDNGYIITGNKGYEDNDGGYGIGYLLKTNQNGNEEWNQTYFFNDNDISLQDVDQTSDEGYVMVGMTYTNSTDVCLVKTDSNGNEIWSKTFGGEGSDRGYSVQQTTDGGYIITGYTESFGNEGYEDFTPRKNVYLIKTDGNGNEQWSQTFGGIGSDYGQSVQQTNDGGYVIGGYSNSFGNEGLIGSFDVYVIKTNQFGNITSTFEIPLPNPNRKLEKTVNLKGQEIKPQTNTPIIEIFDDGSVEKKIVVE